MNKLDYYLVVFILSTIFLLIVGAAKLAVDYAIIIAVLAFLVLVAIKNEV